MKRILTLILLLTIGGIGCGQRTVAPSDLIKWVSDPSNGLTVVKELGDYKLELRYLPTSLLVLQNKENDESVSEEDIKEVEAHYEDMMQFHLKLGSTEGTPFLKTGITDMQEYYSRLEYYTAHVQYDLKLVNGTDTMNCVLSHFERTYGVTPYNMLIVGFDGKLPEKGDLSLIYDDQVLGIGRTKFTITERSIKNIPEIRI